MHAHQPVILQLIILDSTFSRQDSVALRKMSFRYFKLNFSIISQFQAIIVDYFIFRHHDSSNYHFSIYFDFYQFVFQFAKNTSFLARIWGYIAEISPKTALFRRFEPFFGIFDDFIDFLIICHFRGFQPILGHFSCYLRFMSPTSWLIIKSIFSHHQP